MELHFDGRVLGTARTLMSSCLRIAHSFGVDFKPLQREGLIAQCHRDWPDDPLFVAKWTALKARYPQSTVFSSPAWQTAVVHQFVRAWRFRVMTVNRGNDLLAVLPLSLNNVSMLETPGVQISDYMTPLVDPAAETEVWSILLDLLHDPRRRRVGGVVLHNIQGDANIRAVLPPVAARQGWNCEEEIINQCLHIPLPATWDDYLARLDAHERKEIKRKIRNAQIKGNAQWMTLRQVELIRPALERAIEEMMRCQPEKADFTKRILAKYLRRVCRNLVRQGDFFVNELLIEGKPCAWLLGLRSARGPMFYNTTYDPSMRHWSPGIVSFSLAIQDAIAAGHPIFNLLCGGENYKKNLGAIELQLYKITLKPTQ